MRTTFQISEGLLDFIFLGANLLGQLQEDSSRLIIGDFFKMS
jgi:hypothetical protein